LVERAGFAPEHAFKRDTFSQLQPPAVIPPPGILHYAEILRCGKHAQDCRRLVRLRNRFDRRELRISCTGRNIAALLRFVQTGG